MAASEPGLFDLTEIKGVKLRNRIIRSATWEGLAGPQGEVTPRLVEIYRELAAGGCGLVISGLANVLPEGNAFPGCLGLFADHQVAGIRTLAQAVQQAGGTFCLQLGHAGGQATRKSCGVQPLAPSALQPLQYPELPQEMTAADIAHTVAAFASAAKRAKRAGCDAVQLHCAHGYLLNQFLAPHTNQRQDRYGGSIIGRSRLLREVVVAIQQQVGKDYPLLVKLNGSDNLEYGLTLEDATATAKLLDEAGVAAIEISAGTPASGALGPVRRAHESGNEVAYNVMLARSIRAQVDCPIIVVGGIRSQHVMTGLLRTGQADYVSLSRPLICQPDLPIRLQSGTLEKSCCTSCNGCFKTALRGNFCCVLSL